MDGGFDGERDRRQGAGRGRAYRDCETQFVNVVARFCRAAIRYWALAGGVILLALVVITAASAVSNLVIGKPFTGEYELAKHLVGIAIFTFLPYCQLAGANVTVDIFTEGMGTRAKSAMAVVSSLIAAVFALVLLRQMSLGFGDYWRYGEVTPT